MQDWVGLAMTDDALLTGAVLLSTCRYMLRERPDNQIVSQLAMSYQHDSIRALRKSLVNQSLAANRLTVAEAVALVIDSVT